MTKIKYLLIFLGVIGLFGLMGVGFWMLAGRSQPKARVSVEQTGSDDGSQILGDSTDPNSIPLTPSQPRPASSSAGLSVVPSSKADNLGQINSNSEANAKPPTSKASSAQPIDPSTFGQYEKYKEEKNALFGEIQVGTGAELGANMKAAVYYKGWLTNGQLFDASRPDDKGTLQPFIFTMGASQVIPGWEQALAGMKVGGTRLLIVPPAVGYGAAGQGSIPGNSVLIFMVQLAEVQ